MSEREKIQETASQPGRSLSAAWLALDKSKRSVLVKLGLCLVLGLLLMLWARQPLATALDPQQESAPAAAPAAGQSQTGAAAAGEEGLEQELSLILSEIKGAGRVRVKVWYAAGESAVYANQSQTAHSQSLSGSGELAASETEESLSPALVGDGPLLVRQEAPVIQGVLVVAQGAGDAAVQERLYQAVKSLLGLSHGQVAVVEGEAQTEGSEQQ